MFEFAFFSANIDMKLNLECLFKAFEMLYMVRVKALLGVRISTSSWPGFNVMNMHLAHVMEMMLALKC